MKTLLQLNLSGMIRYGGLCVQPVMNLLGRKEAMAVPPLLFACLDYLRVAVGVLPSTVGLVINNGANILIDLFGIHMQLITVNRSKMSASAAVLLNNVSASSLSIPTSGSALVNQGKLKAYDEEDIEDANDRLTLAIFECIESLLIHSGAILNVAIRQTIEQLIQQGLQCMALGTLSVTKVDRRLKRIHFVERLRYSSRLQHALISVALADAIAASKTGMMSLNVIPLRNVCQALVKSTYSDSSSTKLAFEAKKILLTIGQLLYPSAIPMPVVSPADLASQYLVKLKQATDASSLITENAALKNSSTEITSTGDDVAATTEKSVSGGANKKKRSVTGAAKGEQTTTANNTKEVTGAEEPKKESAPVPALNFGNSSASKVPAVAVATGNDSDSDDIPDLDLEDDE